MVAQMANNLTNAEERRLLDASLDGTHLALFTSATDETGAGTEVSGGGYGRQALNWNAAATDGAGATTKLLSADVTFPTASADWGTITHVGIMSAASGGTMRWHAPLATAKAIASGDTYKHLAAQSPASLE